MDKYSMNGLPAHVSRHLEIILLDTTAILKGDHEKLSLFGSTFLIIGKLPLTGTFVEIRDVLIEELRLYDEQAFARLKEKERQDSFQKKFHIPLDGEPPDDWQLGMADPEQKATLPQHCFHYISSLFPEISREDAWALAQIESKRRDVILRKRVPSHEENADYAAMRYADRHVPGVEWEEEPTDWRDQVKEVLWEKRYRTAFRIITHAVMTVVVLTCSRIAYARRAPRTASSASAAGKHRTEDDAGGDGDSDQGEPPGPLNTWTVDILHRLLLDGRCVR